MNDPSALLSTLSQSSAAMVAIIGGFLVSRLVALSSEREGIKRQLKAARERLARHKADYDPAHEYRLNNSISTMQEWMQEVFIDRRAETKDAVLEELLEDRTPRGSSVEEMLPHAQMLRDRVDQAFAEIRGLIAKGDSKQLDLDDPRGRGLKFDEVDEGLYGKVFAAIKRELPSPRLTAQFGLLNPASTHLEFGPIKPGWSHEIDMRRLDDSIREESQLRAQVVAAEQEAERLENDLDVFAQPVGVVSAVLILALFSALGIVLPLLVMGFGAQQLSKCLVAILLACFVIGLASVLVYILWYLRIIVSNNDSIHE